MLFLFQKLIINCNGAKSRKPKEICLFTFMNDIDFLLIK